MKSDKIKNLIFIVVCITLSFSCDNRDIELEKKNEQKAIKLVQEFKNPVISEETRVIMSNLNLMFTLMEGSGQVVEIHGWWAEKISVKKNQYRVTFNYRNITIEEKIEWLVDIDSGLINPLDKLAGSLMGPNYNDWY